MLLQERKIILLMSMAVSNTKHNENENALRINPKEVSTLVIVLNIQSLSIFTFRNQCEVKSKTIISSEENWK